MKILDYKNTNPRDPYVIYHEGKYYTLISFEDKLYLKITNTLDEILDAEMKLVFTPTNEESKSVWAPELHIIDGKPYIYVTMAKIFGEPQHMFVLTTKSGKIDDEYHIISYIKHNDDAWAIDGTILRKDNELYYIYSAFGVYDEKVYQALYIAKMKNPYTLDGDAHLLSKAQYDWELHGCNGADRPYVNEGPFVVYNNNNIYVVYSASGCWTDHYCLALLKYNGGDILDRKNWIKYENPFLDNSCGYIAPGHASFIQNDPSGIEYCAFHAYENDSSKGEKYVHSYIYPIKWENDSIKVIIK